MSLVELCKEGDLEGVKAALKRGADVNTKDEDGWTGLNWAVARNHNSVVALLLKTERNPVSQSSMCSLLSSVDVNVQFNQFLISTVESDDTMSLVELCKHGDLEGVKAALQSGADVNSEDEYGHTGLIWAVSNGHNSVVDLLLNTPNIDVNQSALYWAVEENNNEAVKLLLNVQNIDVNSVDYSGESALQQAVFNNHKSVVALLLSAPNIDVNLKDNYGTCALHGAVEFEKLNEGLKLLLNDPRIDVNIVDKHGWSAVFRAVYRDNIEAVKLLLNVPTNDVNIVDIGGCGVVHHAVYFSTIIGVLKLLLSHPSLTSLTLNRKDNENGDTPVMWAVKMNRLKHLKVLVADPRVDLDTTDKEGRSLEKVARWVFLLHSCWILSFMFIGHHHHLSVTSAIPSAIEKAEMCSIFCQFI